MIKFAINYLKSMRLYYSFVTGICGWVGVAYYESLYGAVSPIKKILVLILLFLSWGINQIFNDYWGLAEDRINAPHRPMVTGALNPKYALILSSTLMLLTSLLVGFFLNPLALIPLILGLLLNYIYEKAKGFGIWGNISFGIMIAMTSLFGFLAIGPIDQNASGRLGIFLFCYLVLLNALLTYFTYFKDFQGDQASGKRTLVVKWGLKKAALAGIFLSLLPALNFIAYCYWSDMALNATFIFLAFLCLFLQLWNAFAFYRSPEGASTYYNLELNFQAYACSFAALIALFNPTLGIKLFALTYIFIGVLFRLHRDRQG